MNAQNINNANTNAANEQLTISLDDDIKIIDGKVMQKQTKVTRTISKCNVGSQGKNKKPQQNDECYTAYDDIIDELKHWGELGKLRDKNIICPCDWDISEDSDVYRIRFDFYTDRTQCSIYEVTKTVTITTESEERIIWVDTEEGKRELEAFFRNKLKCNFVRALIQKASYYGIKSVTASGYNPDLDKGFKFQDVDYSQYDVCITNPPFSIYREFMDCIVGKVDFMVLAPFRNRNLLSIGMHILKGEAYLGFGRVVKMDFINPTEENNYETKEVTCDWVVSWDDAQKRVNELDHHSNTSYELYKDSYEFCENMTMKDGTHPLRVPATRVPEDYDGWMFTDVGILTNLNTDKYELYCTSFFKYYNQEHPELNPFAHKFTNDMLIHNGGKFAHGFLIHKKQH